MKLLAVTVLAVLGVLAMAATTSAQLTYFRTTVTIRAQGADLSGFVYTRNRPRCARNRVVTVFRQRGTRQSPTTDTRLGSDSASLNGTRYMWSTGNSGMSGRLYARARRIRGCLADTSPTIVVPPQP